MPVRNARASPRGTAASIHAAVGCTYAPRPGRSPVGSTSIDPSGERTIRSSSDRGAAARQPAHVRSGTCPRRTGQAPAGASGVAAAWDSDLMSIRQPVRRAASLAFCPSFPIASDS